MRILGLGRQHSLLQALEMSRILTQVWGVWKAFTAFWAKASLPTGCASVPPLCLTHVPPRTAVTSEVCSVLLFLRPSLPCTVHTQGQRQHTSLCLTVLWLSLRVFPHSFHFHSFSQLLFMGHLLCVRDRPVLRIQRWMRLSLCPHGAYCLD